jgi:hypothetical protein
VNSKTIMVDYISLLVVIKIRFGSIARKSIGERISRRVGLKQGPRTNSHREAASIASIFLSRG